MPKKWSHTEAFAHFGTKPKNVQWSWSARSADGNTVVVTLWQDQFEKRDGHLIYARPANELGHPDTRPGFSELMEHFAWARDRCGGRFSVIIAIAKDPNVEPRSIKECFPSKMVMRLTSLDITTGAFAAVADVDSPAT
jgi:hypothetical protein